MKQAYEAKIKELQKELLTAQKPLHEIITTCRNTLKSKSEELQEALNEQKTLFKTVKKLEKDLSELQESQKETTELREKLEKNLYEKSNVIEKLKFKLAESRSKVHEAVHVVEAALLEKDEALKRENDARGRIPEKKKNSQLADFFSNFRGSEQND